MIFRASFASTRRSLSTASASSPPHLLSLADLSVPQIQHILELSAELKAYHKALSVPPFTTSHPQHARLSEKPLSGKTIALMFNKRSTRTRVASESATALLGGHPMFLGSADIQLGVNETLYDTSKVVSSMVDGIMARVGDHEEVEVRFCPGCLCMCSLLGVDLTRDGLLSHRRYP